MPHGKMSWYGPQGGLWQSVELVARTDPHRAIRLDPHFPSGRLEMRLALSRPHDGMVALEVAGPDGAPSIPRRSPPRATPWPMP
jgi:hypothetical protein